MRIIKIIFLLVAPLMLSSCASTYNSATGRSEYTLIDRAQEEKIGQELNREILSKYPVSGKSANADMVFRVGSRIVSSIKGRRINYKFGAVKDSNLNAFTIPGGYIYATSGLIENVASEDELAAVLAHEIGHSEARHAVKQLEAALSYSSVMQLAYYLDTREEDKKGCWKYLKSGADIVFRLMTLGYSRKDELTADWLSIKYVKAAGYDPQGIISVMKKAGSLENKNDPHWLYFLRSHPYMEERMAAVEAELSTPGTARK